MARENDVPMILPAAFYFAPIISPSRLVMLHLKLALDVLATILAGREQITQSAYSVAWSWLFQRLTADMCHDPDMCDQRRLSVVQDMWRSSAPCLFLREMPHESEKRRGESDSEGVEEWVCGPCMDAWTVSEKKNYKDLWNSLPSFFKLPKWEVVLKDSE